MSCWVGYHYKANFLWFLNRYAYSTTWTHIYRTQRFQYIDTRSHNYSKILDLTWFFILKIQIHGILWHSGELWLFQTLLLPCSFMSSLVQLWSKRPYDNRKYYILSIVDFQNHPWFGLCTYVLQNDLHETLQINFGAFIKIVNTRFEV